MTPAIPAAPDARDPQQQAPTTFASWHFSGVDDASRAERRLATVSAAQRLRVDDAVLLLWPASTAAPLMRSTGNVAQLAPLRQYFWGMLFGHAFAAPLLGDEPSPQYLWEVGVDEAYVTTLRAEVLPGTSALLVVTRARLDRRLALDVAGEPGCARFTQIRLTSAQSRNLRRVFAH